MSVAGWTIGSLFSGVGGLERGLESCGLGPVLWQCERDAYAYNVLECRFPAARRWRDVRSMDGSAGHVEIICGGFPCQDVSVAGKGAGLDGKRSGLWSEFARVVRLLRPRFVFVENVAALRSRGLDRVLGDLAALGFDAEWCCTRAVDVGAPHIRERLFVLAYADGHAVRQLAERIEQRQAERGEPVAGGNGEGACGELANAEGERRREGLAESVAEGETVACGGSGHGGIGLANADSGGCEGERRQEPEGVEGARWRQPDRQGAGGYIHRFPPGPDGIAGWDGPAPAVRRGTDGSARWVDRLRCLGNAVVPQQAALALRTLAARAAEVAQ